ncbi:MAG: hypothetical protein JWM78_1240 [Verrucomicrobiaceae bacterium]|nr:hypothetical protein [Verrucomicrobiaceae bacterium]
MNTSILRTALFPLLLISAATSFADTASDRAEMQKKLNQETMDKPFAVEDVAKIDTYIADAMKKNLQPKKVAPNGWQSGYTCDSYYQTYTYNYNGYRDCMYYHRYYGRYW